MKSYILGMNSKIHSHSFQVGETGECGIFRTHWAAAPAVAGCSPAQACPVFGTVTRSVTLYAHSHVGSGLWPRSPSRILWLGWHRQTPIFHSRWNTARSSVPPLTDTIIEKTHIINHSEILLRGSVYTTKVWFVSYLSSASSWNFLC